MADFPPPSLLALSFHPPTRKARKNGTSPAGGWGGGHGGCCEVERGELVLGREGRQGQGRGEGEGGSVQKGRLAIPSQSTSVWRQGLCRLRATFPRPFKHLPFAAQSDGYLVGATWALKTGYPAVLQGPRRGRRLPHGGEAGGLKPAANTGA